MIIGDIVKNVLFPYRGIGLVISRAVRASDPQWDHWNVLWPHGEVVAYSQSLLELVNESR